MKRSTWSVVAGFALSLGMAAAASAANGRHPPLTRAQLPVDFAIGSGSPPLSLKVTLADGKVASVAVGGAAGANVSATSSAGDNQTTLSMSTTLDVPMKFDLYLSRDGRTFEYASTCAVTPGISGFEMWEYPVREFALGNPRVASGRDLSCD